MNSKVMVVVEDDPDIRVLIRLSLTADPRIELDGEATTALQAVEIARSSQPGLIILDHQIEGDIMGVEAAPLLKGAAPNSKILLFSAFDLSVEADKSEWIDSFLSKKRFDELLSRAQEMIGLPPL